MREWISVEDRLPETNQNVLTWGGHTEPTTLWFDDSDEKWKDNDEEFTEIVGITHWMPLPEPPQE